MCVSLYREQSTNVFITKIICSFGQNSNFASLGEIVHEAKESTSNVQNNNKNIFIHKRTFPPSN